MHEQLIKDLVSYPFLRRGNWQLKISVLKNMSVVVVGNHMMFIDKFFVKHFGNLEQAADFIEFIILKEELNGGHQTD
jgi:hypothetical protein